MFELWSGARKKQTLNITELDKIDIDIPLLDDEFTFTNDKGQEETVKQKIIRVGGEKYKVPVSVLRQLKEQIKENPKLQYFKVKKSGEGLKTVYTVIPLGNSGVVEEAVK